MDKVKNEESGFTPLTESQWNAIEEELALEEERNIEPFGYPPFYSKSCKVIILVTCIITVIIGLCIVSSVLSQLPAYKEFMEYARMEELTAEQEQRANSLGTSVILYFGLGALIVAGITVAAGFIVRKIKTSIDFKKYTAEKNAAQSRWSEIRQSRLQAAREGAVYSVCRFCGGKIYHIVNEPEKAAYYETVYDVAATGYDKATLTPRTVSHEYLDYRNAYEKCGCNACGYEVSVTHNEFGTQKYVNVNLTSKARVSRGEVEGGNLYKMLKG